MNILAIGPHPDDIECYCAGTLAKYAQRGDNVYMAVITNGNKGSVEYSESELAKIRLKETQDSAAVIGADLICFGEEDTGVFCSETLRNRFIDLVRYTKADIVICPSPNDYHPDHRNCSQLTQDACLLSTVSLIITEHEAMDKIPYIIFYDHPNGIEFYPAEYVDITDTFKIKKEMFLSHKSQIPWLENQYNMNAIYSIETIARFRGLACQCTYAEGFVINKTFPGAPPYRLLP